MAKPSRRGLTDALRQRLVAALEQVGFEAVASTAEEKRGEVGAAFPFGRLRRATVGGFDLVEIQLHKDGSAAFRLNLAKVPVDGIDHASGHIVAENVWVHYLDHFCTLYAGRFLRRWFRVDDDASQEHIEALIDRVIDLIPQVELYFKEGRAGRNLRCV